MAPCGEPVVPCVPRVGFRRIRIPGSVAAPLSLVDAVSFLRGLCPWYHSRRLYVPNPPPLASQAFNVSGGGVRRSPRCTYPLILVFEGNTLNHCSITFSWSSAPSWVLRVWSAPLPGPLQIRLAGEEG